MRIKQVIGLVILFIGPFSIPSNGQVVADLDHSSGNWSNSANWSTCPPAACPVVPNNGNGISYTAEINLDVSVTLMQAGPWSAICSCLETFTMMEFPTLTVGNLFTGQAGLNTINWGNGSTL